MRGKQSAKTPLPPGEAFINPESKAMNTVSLVGRISERGVRLEYTPERAKP
jgi:hypothetical protein